MKTAPIARTVEPVRIPKGLVFPVNPKGPVVLPVDARDGEKYTLHIGGVSPLGGSPDQLCPQMTFRHERVLFRMLEHAGWLPAPEFPIDYTDLLSSDGYEQRVILRRLLNELGSCWVHITFPGSDRVLSAPLLHYNPQIYLRKGVDSSSGSAREDERNIRYRRLTKITFNEYFWRAFINFKECWNLRADAIDRLYSDIAAASYILLGTRAFEPSISETNKGRKDAASLLREIGASVPENRSLLRQVFERARGNSRSILQSLNGLPLWKGYLRVDEELEENSSGDGYNIRFWIQREILPEGVDPENDIRAKGRLLDTWLSMGLSRDQFEQMQNKDWRKLNVYQEEALRGFGYPLDHDRAYVELVRSFVGSDRLDAAIHDVRGEIAVRGVSTKKGDERAKASTGKGRDRPLRSRAHRGISGAS